MNSFNSFCRRYGWWLIFIVLTVGCSDHQSPDEESHHSQFPAFAEFPHKSFYDITLGEAAPDVELKLTAIGFEKIDSSGSAHYLHRADSMEVILPDNPQVNAFRVFLRSVYYLDRRSDLHDWFAVQAIEIRAGNDFSVYRYRLGRAEYKLTVFSQSEYLRLSYEQKPSM